MKDFQIFELCRWTWAVLPNHVFLYLLGLIAYYCVNLCVLDRRLQIACWLWPSLQFIECFFTMFVLLCNHPQLRQVEPEVHPHMQVNWSQTFARIKPKLPGPALRPGDVFYFIILQYANQCYLLYRILIC